MWWETRRTEDTGVREAPSSFLQPGPECRDAWGADPSRSTSSLLESYGAILWEMLTIVSNCHKSHDANGAAESHFNLKVVENGHLSWLFPCAARMSGATDLLASTQEPWGAVLLRCRGQSRGSGPLPQEPKNAGFGFVLFLRQGKDQSRQCPPTTVLGITGKSRHYEAHTHPHLMAFPIRP